jgi:hypothetical protein
MSQNQIRQLFYNNQCLVQKDQLPGSLKEFMDNYQQLESFNISFNVEKDKIFSKMIWGGEFELSFSDTIVTIYYLYFKKHEEIHVLIPYLGDLKRYGIDNISEVRIYSINGKQKYWFLNHFANPQRYIIESYLTQNDSVTVKRVSFHPNILINPNNADVHYLKREKPIAFLTINEYIELIENFKNEFYDNSITKTFKEHKNDIPWYEFK